MYLGKTVELANTDELFDSPLHPYASALISAVPIPDPETKMERIMLPGKVPSPIKPPTGCRFHPRCPKVMVDKCPVTEPPLEDVGNGHYVACLLYTKA